jgi:hypothetical protein
LRVVAENVVTDRQTDGRIHLLTNQVQPSSACAPRVNKDIFKCRFSVISNVSTSICPLYVTAVYDD